MQVISPITKNSNVTIVKKYSSLYLISQWKELFGIDVSDDFKSVDEVYFCECNESKIRFYYPLDIAGSDKLYKQLSEKYEWYYGDEKWEFEISSKIVKKISPKSLLEIGAGKGHFLKKVIPFVKETLGIEFNQDALLYASKEKLPIKNFTFSQLIESSASYDFIVSFEVFEHVNDPLSFVENSLKLLNDNGYMLIAVPNRDSFIKYGEVLLDMPPHHMLSLSLDFFKYLATKFDLDLELVEYEPLAIYHIDFYINLLRERFRSKVQSTTLRRGFDLFCKCYKLLLSFDIFRSLVRGQTILVVMRKK
ncbi:class I SAM-dependent methyltransferase [Leptospira bourretii]|uniref:Class I SAM-dependent methyltransferase n=1 Tax=Leptospira bourretii TaxID=2484962 RepID=A0A4R9IJT3_9LEPT|nr:class I SAM-dependent methyltransferase [Leptospira bourretii]TGK79438.1 class I SAM-dependent methyltransferase [Leptospira bourretii]TGK89645.1 class I SAM-dependent methyltransferase [Leptospira bourretii]TGL19592.1 class I SAM-dependent methyltransferase [Leptospira bourretii]TGL31273.1 class I SAM-dependent methyltransferase [Leptospira bourretii]